MLKKTLFNLFTSFAMPLLFSNSVMAETIIYSRTFYPTICQMAVDDVETECDWVTMGLVSDYSAFNVKLCRSGYRCLILIGASSELDNYPDTMHISSIAWQEGNQIVQRWSGNLVLTPYQRGYILAGKVKGSVVLAYFE